MSDQMFLSRTAAAKACDVSVDTITKAINAKKLLAKRTGVNAHGEPSGKYLISRTALAAWFDGLADA